MTRTEASRSVMVRYRARSKARMAESAADYQGWAAVVRARARLNRLPPDLDDLQTYARLIDEERVDAGLPPLPEYR